MTVPADASFLERIARRPRRAPRATESPPERCELCALPLPTAHPHLLDVERRSVRCACTACAILFDRAPAAEGRLRRIPDRRLRLGVHELDAMWALLGVPVDLAFFVAESQSAPPDVVVHHPSPIGTTRAKVDAAAWAALVDDLPVLADLEPHVEALLARRAPDGRAFYVVPIDDCFRLLGVMARSWKGFSGGPQVWADIGAFFDDLDRRARPRTGRPTTTRR